jgi:hypothetical protein
MKKLLLQIENIINFTRATSLRNPLIFSKVWTESQDWQKLKAVYNLRWSRNATENWIDFYPVVAMPIDFLEEAERRKSRATQDLNKSTKWGLDIGVRYFPEREYYPPVFIHELLFLATELNMPAAIAQQTDKFKFLHVFELMLSGDLIFLQKKQKTMYKHWIYNNIEESRLIEFYEKKGIMWHDMEKFMQNGSMHKFFHYGAQLDSKLINIQKKVRRYMRWEILRMHKEGIMSKQISAVGFRHIALKFVFDVVTKRIYR